MKPDHPDQTSDLSARIEAAERQFRETLARFRKRMEAFELDGRSCEEFLASLPADVRDGARKAARLMRDKLARQAPRPADRPRTRKVPRNLV